MIERFIEVGDVESENATPNLARRRVLNNLYSLHKHKKPMSLCSLGGRILHWKTRLMQPWKNPEPVPKSWRIQGVKWEDISKREEKSTFFLEKEDKKRTFFSLKLIHKRQK